MAEPTIPLWKQELLKRKQGKLTHEKLISAQNPKESFSRDRSSFANSTSNVLNHRSNNTEKKPTDVQQHGHNKNYSDVTKKGTMYNRNVVLDESVDSSDARQRPSSLKTQFSSVDSGPSRLDNFEDRAVKSNRNTGKHYNNFAFARDSSGTHGISLRNRGHNRQEDSSRIKLDESKKDRLTMSMSEPVIGLDHGVDSEHIKPQDLKKMWQRQATKGETTKAHITHSKSPITHMKKETQRGPRSPHQDFPNQNHTLVSSTTPKAYKSPYAKAEWCRQTSLNHETSVKSGTASKIQKNDVTLHAVRPALTNGAVAKDLHNEKVEDEHIQSVKSLLGLFGGRAKVKIGRKISDNVILDNKTEKQPHGKDYRTLEINNYTSKRPGLFKHHSEPNLLFPADKEGFTDTPTSPKKSPTHEVATEEVAQPSHHVSQGIQERMTRLRRASHSNMEDMDGFMDYQNGLNSDVGHVQDNLEFKSATQNESSQQIETVHKECSSSKLENSKHATSKTKADNRGDMFDNFTTTTVQNDIEKPRLSGNVNSNDEVPSPVGNTHNIAGNDPNDVNNAQSKTEDIRTKSQDKHSLPEQSFHNHLSVFGSTVAKKTATEPDMSDTKEYKSENKFYGKQSNYVVENDQSDSGLHNAVVSTEYSTGIKLNQQEVKPVIKNKESTTNIEDSTQKKPRRKGLNVIDPLAVLQLTKDPILLKEKPATAELGLLKESQSGRKPKVEIIKHEPDKKAKIAQINRAWDLDNVQPSLKQNDVAQKTMPASSIQVSPTAPHNIPVTSIDDVPVSIIDDVANKPETDVETKSNITSGNATFYNGTLSSETAELETESIESDEEFIPVSSIDAEVDLGPPPEVVFDKMPEKVKSCFARNEQKQGKVSFFQHVFIHDYQSETAAAADWDFENGTSFSSYMPAAVKQYEDVSKSSNSQPPPTTPVEPTATPSEGTRYDEPLITYNEDESVDFTGSSDSTAGALLF